MLRERLLTSRGLSSDSTCVFEAELGKFIYSLLSVYQVDSLFKVANYLCVDSVIQKVQCHHDPIKIDNVYQAIGMVTVLH